MKLPFLRFLKASFSNPFLTGSIAPSSQELAQKILGGLELETAQWVLEVGPGSGALTQVIAKRISSPGVYTGIELNGGLVASLQEHFPQLEFIHDSIEHLDRYRDRVQSVDVVVCSLPWMLLPAYLVDRAMANMEAVLKPGGVMCTYSYWHCKTFPQYGRWREVMAKTFHSVEEGPVVWWNAPPAVIYHLRKKS